MHFPVIDEFPTWAESCPLSLVIFLAMFDDTMGFSARLAAAQRTRIFSSTTSCNSSLNPRRHQSPPCPIPSPPATERWGNVGWKKDGLVKGVEPRSRIIWKQQTRCFFYRREKTTKQVVCETEDRFCLAIVVEIRSDNKKEWQWITAVSYR
jgi:hypothetical protein